MRIHSLKGLLVCYRLLVLGVRIALFLSVLYLGVPQLSTSQFTFSKPMSPLFSLHIRFEFSHRSQANAGPMDLFSSGVYHRGRLDST